MQSENSSPIYHINLFKELEDLFDCIQTKLEKNQFIFYIFYYSIKDKKWFILFFEKKSNEINKIYNNTINSSQKDLIYSSILQCISKENLIKLYFTLKLFNQLSICNSLTLFEKTFIKNKGKIFTSNCK